MAVLREQLALAAGLGRAQARLIKQARALHDIGKVAIPDDVLLKPGKFSARDREIMSEHAARGAELLSESTSPLVQMAEAIALTHHERWDGGGYPAGLAGEEIPLAGRICAICDVFDALVSRRRYKARWSLEAALAEISDESGAHFDPRLTELFVRIAPPLYLKLAEADPDLSTDAPEQDGGTGTATGPGPAESAAGSALVTA